MHFELINRNLSHQPLILFLSDFYDSEDEDFDDSEDDSYDKYIPFPTAPNLFM